MKTIRFLIIYSIFLLYGTLTAQEIEIYVSDAGNFSIPPWQILKFDSNGENPEVYIDENLTWPQDILFLEDQDVVLISNLTNPGSIGKHDLMTGAYLENFADGIAGPTRMKIGIDNLLYVLQWSQTDNKVLRYQLDGSFVDEFTSIGVPQSIGLDWDSEGNLYVSSYGGAFVRHFDPSGNDLGVFIDENLQGPTNIWFGENGDLFVVDYDGGAVKRFDSEGNYLGIFMSGLGTPEGVAFYPEDHILIGNGSTGAVKLFDDDGTYIEDFIPAGSGNLIRPNAVVVRENLSVSIAEPNFSSDFLINTTGRYFQIHPDYSTRMEHIEVFNTMGRRVDHYRIKPIIGWDAESLVPGLYIFIAWMSDGSFGKKKIIVK
jgi:hypothetical protein